VAAPDLLTDGVVTLRAAPATADGAVHGFVVEHEGADVGAVAVRRTSDSEGDLTWSLAEDQRGRGFATRAVRLLVGHALGTLGMTRVQARVAPADDRAVRVATRSGLLREGVLRIEPGSGEDPATTELVLLSRLRSDPSLDDPRGFRSLLNSFLPRKRAIAQLLVRDPADRVLLCRLTYKEDWDLPGGVVEVNESPRDAVRREVEEELDLVLDAGPLLLTDWLPPWSGWDDALALVYDGGVHAATLLGGTTLQAREIRDVEFCTPQQVRDREASTRPLGRSQVPDHVARRDPAAPDHVEDHPEAGVVDRRHRPQQVGLGREAELVHGHHDAPLHAAPHREHDLLPHRQVVPHPAVLHQAHGGPGVEDQVGTQPRRVDRPPERLPRGGQARGADQVQRPLVVVGDVVLPLERHRPPHVRREGVGQPRVVGDPAPPVGERHRGQLPDQVGAQPQQALEAAEATARLAAAQPPVRDADRPHPVPHHASVAHVDRSHRLPHQ
jgi:8-oxo-dGTP pyrophosphatase MutT (NUDIX family)